MIFLLAARTFCKMSQFSNYLDLASFYSLSSSGVRFTTNNYFFLEKFLRLRVRVVLFNINWYNMFFAVRLAIGRLFWALGLRQHFFYSNHNKRVFVGTFLIELTWLKDIHSINGTFSFFVCARLAQLVRSLTANQEVPGSIPGLVEGWTLGDLLSPFCPWTGTLSRWSSLSTFYRGI